MKTPRKKKARKKANPLTKKRYSIADAAAVGLAAGVTVGLAINL